MIIQFDGENSFIDDKINVKKIFSYSLKKKVKDIPEEDYFILIGKDGGLKIYLLRIPEMKLFLT